MALLGQHAYVERYVPNLDVAFWQEWEDGSHLNHADKYCLCQ